MAVKYPGKRIEINFLKLFLALAFTLLIAGIFTPVMTITKLLFLENSFSIVSGLADLFSQQHYFLFILISLLSIALPIIKIFLLAWALQSNKQRQQLDKLINLIHNYGRWAMLDVFVVALLMVAVKLGAIASVEVHNGLYWFATAVLITMYVTHRTVALLQKKSTES